MKYNYPTLTKEQRDIIIGTSLGDAHLKTQTRGDTYSIHFEQSIKKRVYVEHLYDVFFSLVNPDTPPAVRVAEKGTKLAFTTLNHPSLRHYGRLFNWSTTEDELKKGVGRKQVPKNIYKYLSDRALAYWFMDDGALKGNNRSGKTIHTEGFTKESVYILQDALIRKGIDTKVHIQNRDYNGTPKRYYILYITAKGDPIFTEKIRPFMHPVFKYKLGNDTPCS